MENIQKELLSNLNENSSLSDIQNYIKNVIDIRGFSNQNVEQTMLLLTEETGELAKSIRKYATNMEFDKEKLYNYDTIENEIADCFIVLTSICNKLNIDMFNTIKEKEKINTNRKWTK